MQTQEMNHGWLSNWARRWGPSILGGQGVGAQGEADRAKAAVSWAHTSLMSSTQGSWKMRQHLDIHFPSPVPHPWFCRLEELLQLVIWASVSSPAKWAWESKAILTLYTKKLRYKVIEESFWECHGWSFWLVQKLVREWIWKWFVGGSKRAQQVKLAPQSWRLWSSSPRACIKVEGRSNSTELPSDMCCGPHPFTSQTITTVKKERKWLVHFGKDFAIFSILRLKSKQTKH